MKPEHLALARSQYLELVRAWERWDEDGAPTTASADDYTDADAWSIGWFYGFADGIGVSIYDVQAETIGTFELDGEAISIDEFCKANAETFSVEEDWIPIFSLEVGASFTGGGGASAEWTIKRTS